MGVKRTIRKALTSVFGNDFNRLNASRVEKAAVISFDVFDTLVIRNCSDPYIVFDIVERRYNTMRPSEKISGFRKARIVAEQLARNLVSTEEPTVFDIYALLDSRFKHVAPELLKLELDTELSICRANPDAKMLYDAIQASGKRIVITSDMYLDAEVIAYILDKCGFSGYEHLYVSSEIGVTKFSGRLFEIIKKDMGVSGRKILHVGDHFQSDYLAPRMAGIHSFLYRRRTRKANLYTSRFGYRGDSLANDILNSITTNGMSENSADVRDWMGYAVLGPLLLGYSNWLHHMWNNEGRPGILFLAREGNILMRAWNCLYGNNGEARYINISRLAVCRAMAGKAVNSDEFFEVFSCLTSGCETIEDILQILCPDADAAVIDRLDSDFDLPLDSSSKDMIFDIIIQIFGNYYDSQRQLFSEYLQEKTRFGDDMHADDSLLICDIGWTGTMQALLKRAMPSKKLIGAYLAVSDFHDGETKMLKRGELDRRGYWCDSNRWKSDGQILRFTQSAIETLFLNSEGTTIAYGRKCEKVVPVKGASEYLAETEQSVTRLHEAALGFIDECRHAKLDELVGPLDCHTAMLPYMNTVAHPTGKALSLFSRFLFVDGIKAVSLLPKHNLPYYLTHPIAAVHELELSNSKIIWLKGAIRLPLPYYRLLCFLTSGIGLKSNYARSIES